MSGRLVHLVLEQSTQKGSARTVLSVIAEAIGDTGPDGNFVPDVDTLAKYGKCWLSVSRIAARANITERHAYRIIRRLCDSGELIANSRASRAGTNLYSLGLRCRPDVDKSCTPTSHQSPEDAGCQGDPDTLASATLTSRSAKPYWNLNKSVREANGEKETAAEELAKRLRDAGVRDANASPGLVEAIQKGVSYEACLAACQRFRAKANPFAYAIAVLIKEAQRAALPQEVQLVSWGGAPRSAVEAEGARLGIGRWDERKEQWLTYKSRVKAASGLAEIPFGSFLAP